MSSLKLYLLGPPRIEVDGEPVEIGRRKALTLLIYLAVTGEGQRRDTLAALLWPENTQSSARAALRRDLSILKKAVGEEWLVMGGQTVGLRQEPDFWLDVETFQQRLADSKTHGHLPSEVCADCLPLLIEAVALHRDNFLAGFTLRDSPLFDEWQFFQAESLRQELTSVLERLVRGLGAEQKYEAAISYARRWVSLDSLHEPAHRELMRLYAGDGQRAAALRQYDECVRLLQDELGVLPSAETTDLHQAIETGRISSPSTVELDTPPDPSPPRLDQSLPFYGEGEPPEVESSSFVARERELTLLDSFLEKALAGRGQVVFVTGEAGQGKTSLMQEFARRAQEAQPQLIVASGLCDVYTGIGDPYLPFRDVMSMLTGDVETQWASGAVSRDHALRLWNLLPHMTRLLVDRGPNLIDTFIAGGPLAERAATYAGGKTDWVSRLQVLLSDKVSPGEREAATQPRLFEEFTEVLTALAKEHPLLLILDDLHWADLSSISLLSHLGRRITEHPILIVGAYRPEDVVLARAGERHPLEDVLSEFKRQFGEVWVSLDRSEPTDERAFIDAILDIELNRLDESFRRELARRTEGHPLFTTELLRDMQSRGDLWQDEEGCWVARPDLKWEAFPARIEGVIEQRISRLDAELREVLTVASVAGEEFIAEAIAQVGDVDELKLVRRLSGELDKQHRLVQEKGIQRVGSRRLSRYRFQHNLFQMYLYHGLGEAERAYLHEDMGHALEELYGDRANKNATIALQLARHFQIAGLRPKAIHYLRQAGDAAGRAYANDEASNHYRQALGLAQQAESVTGEELTDLYTDLGRSLELNAKFQEALATYEAMETVANQHRNQPMELAALIHQGRIRCTTNPEFNPELGEVVSKRGLTLAQALGDPVAEAEVRWNMLNLYRWSDRMAQAIASGEDALALIRSQDPSTDAAPKLRQLLAYVLNDLSHCYSGSGNLEQAIATSREASHLWQTLNNKPMLADCLATASYIHTYTGQYDQAIDFSKKAWQISESTGNVWGQSYSRVQIGNAYWERGQVGQAITMMEDSIRLSEISGFFVPQVMTRADLATVYGDLGTFDQGLEIARLALTAAKTKLPALRVCALAAVAHLQLWQGNLAEAEAAIDQGNNDPHRKTASAFVVRFILAEGELAFRQGDYERALTAADTLLTSLRQFEADRPRALYLQGKALLGLGQEEAARESLLEARTKAEAIGSQRMLWQILAMLAAVESDPAEAIRMRQQAGNIVEYIAEQIPTAELRTSFLNLPHVRPVLGA